MTNCKKENAFEHYSQKRFPYLLVLSSTSELEHYIKLILERYVVQSCLGDDAIIKSISQHLNISRPAAGNWSLILANIEVLA